MLAWSVTRVRLGCLACLVCASAILLDARQSASARRALPCAAIVATANTGLAAAQLRRRTRFAEAALALARCDEVEHLRLLGQTLRNAAWMNRLFRHDQRALRCRLDPVLRALAANPAAEARKQFLGLLGARPFIRSADRVGSLIRASGWLRPPTPELLRFWRRHSRPLDGFVNLTVAALATNGTRPAIRLLAELLADRRHGADERAGWMRWHVLEHRHELIMLQAAHRLLAPGGGLSARLRRCLVESLFDYRPQQWCRPDSCMRPPPRSAMPPGARQELRQIAALASRMKLGQRLDRAIAATLAELDQLDRATVRPR